MTCGKWPVFEEVGRPRNDEVFVGVACLVSSKHQTPSLSRHPGLLAQLAKALIAYPGSLGSNPDTAVSYKNGIITKLSSVARRNCFSIFLE